MKSELRKNFHLFYANEVLKQLVPIDKIKVDFRLSSIKFKSASWIMSSWTDEIQKRSELAINRLEKLEFLTLSNNYN